jgi:hypothetical protein
MVRSAPPEKALLAGGDDAALDRLVGEATCVDDLFQFVHHLGVKTFIELAGHVPGDERDAVGVGLDLEVGVVPLEKSLKSLRSRAD